MSLPRLLTLTPAIAAITVIVAAAPSHAASVIAVGGDTTPRQVPFTATTPGIDFDTNYGLPTACGAGSFSGVVNVGEDVPGSGVISMDSSTWTDCTWPTIFGMEFDTTQTASWDLNVTSIAPGGVAQITVTGIVTWEWRSVEPGACDFDVSGALEGSFDTNTQTITFDDPNDDYPLTISDASTCFGEVLDGDRMQMIADYEVTTAEGPITFQ